MKFAVSVFGNQPMPQIVERVKMIEALGFDAVWFGDLQRICREVYVEMTACALNTSRITLGIGVTMPTTRHASVTASAFASLHDLAPGRIRAGISTGDSGVRSIGRRPESIASLESYIRQVKGLLQNEVVEFDEGGSAKLAWLQSPTDIPIYVAATGPRLTRAAGRMADGAILLRERDPAQMAAGVEMFKEAASAAGKSPSETKLSCWLQTCLGPDRTLARRKLNGPVGVIINMSNPALFDEEDLPLIAKLKANYNPSKHSRSYVSDEFRIPGQVHRPLRPRRRPGRCHLLHQTTLHRRGPGRDYPRPPAHPRGPRPNSRRDHPLLRRRGAASRSLTAPSPLHPVSLVGQSHRNWAFESYLCVSR